ncbi:CRISPR-associated endoribonuclease Cas6 [Streptomyces hainanensis]|uniref:CRISPR-associated endoribonuclease Cas6 n=1 Tax=Streptomyces hainanensis TaxID=402648 RepID=A0A4R4TYY8_9ACTN|nr:CRISPR-associated endoribonuclease Cas6 [Streptomyces hainanensis]TDC80513.1 CRISPR-associated endoribonuclease Cas6 [Streptomyces hainanensis]
MRIRVDVETDAASLRWEDVHGPARGVVYALLGSEDADMARSLHDNGWKGHPLKPLGLTSPQFRGARPVDGVYTTSRDGAIWFGSPVPEIASVLVKSLASRTEIVWGSTRLKVRGFQLDFGATPQGKLVELATATPVILKRENRFLLPGEPHFMECLERNLAHKADVLGLPAPRSVQLLEAGPRRRFTVRGAPRHGAQVRVAMEADGRFVGALRSWGLGLDTIQGFGWIR